MDPSIDNRYRGSRRSRSRSRSPSPSSSSSKPSRGRNYDRDRPPSHRYHESGFYSEQQLYHQPRNQSLSRRYDEEPYHSKADRDPTEEQRRMKMAKLRAENEAEERRLTNIQEAATNIGSKLSSEDKNKNKNNNSLAKESILEIQEGELEDYEEDEQMQMLLGFSTGFGSTKGKAVDDNHKSASKGVAAKNKARKYRQYMNRKGGFNRPLDPMK